MLSYNFIENIMLLLCGIFLATVGAYIILGDRDCFRVIKCLIELLLQSCFKKPNLLHRQPEQPTAYSTACPTTKHDVPTTRQRVILITDIGRDTDSPLALIALAKHPDIELAGVITTGGNTINRARVARYWLRRCGIDDKDCYVIPDYSHFCSYTDVRKKKLYNHCHVPLCADDALHSTIYRNTRYDAVEFIVREVREWKEKIHIICLGRTTTLTDAFETNPKIMCQVGRVVIQGNLKYENDATALILEDCISESLHEDEMATEILFESFEYNGVPLHIVDQNIGEICRLNKEDLSKTTHYINTIRGTFKFMMDYDYEKFSTEHGLSEYKHPSTWFNQITCVCVPSKTLLILSYVKPHWFTDMIQHHDKHTVVTKPKDDVNVYDMKKYLVKLISVDDTS